MKKADKNVYITTNTVGIDNEVNITVNVHKSSSKIPVAVAIVAAAALLAVSLCCPEKLADVVRFIVDTAAGS